MKKFNKVITVEMEVDFIAGMLLESLRPELAHRELICETIVGRMLNDGSLSYLHNSLAGYPHEINFKVGDVVRNEKSEVSTYGFWTAESIQGKNTVRKTITEATIAEINIYSDKKLRIVYEVPDSSGGTETRTQWVRHTDWNLVP